MNIGIILPNQLFKNSKLLNNCDIIYLIEDNTFFTKYPFHKQKLILHRASMKFYYDYLKKNKKVIYLDFNKYNYNLIFQKNNIHIYDPIDHDLETLFKNLAIKNKIQLKIYENHLFLESNEELDKYYNSLTNHKNYIQDKFYRWQRERLNILMNGKKPLFNLWSFDKDNRKPFDKSYKEPKQPKINNNKYVLEAIKYINLNFKNNFGSTESFIYPVTYSEAKKLFKNFIKYKIFNFGIFQDAVDSNVIFGSHSLLSSSLNIGLISVKHLIEKILAFFNKLNENKQKEYISSVEGFIRQIIGWRSYVRFIYKYHGKIMFKDNNLNNLNKLNNDWFIGRTEIYPIDNIIKKIHKYAYAHHIERLMYLGNFALLNLINPIEIYNWFMICFIDSYEWVMIPNVMGMSLYSSKNIKMMTKPYFSSSNYIKLLSNYKLNSYNKIKLKNKEYYWNEVWDSLYYNFINKNESLLASIYSTSRNVYHWKHKTNDEKKEYLNIAKLYLEKNY